MHSCALVNEAIGGIIIRMWLNWSGIIEYERTHIYTPNCARKATRKGFSYPDYYTPFEYLYSEAKKMFPEIGLYSLKEA